MPDALQSPESTPTTTSGGSGKPNDGAPAGAKDVAGKVTNEEVVDNEVDWASAGEPDTDEVVQGEEPRTDETSTEDEVEKPAKPSSKPAEKPKQKPAAPKSDEEKPAPKSDKPGEEEQSDDESTTRPPAKDDEPETPKPETEEQKRDREEQERQAEEKAFNDLKTYYALPEDAVERLRTEPELVLPELAAKMHRAVMVNAERQMMQRMPQMLQQYTQLQEANAAAKEAFFSRWPSLKGHEAQVLKTGEYFRSVNPKATPQERLEQVGKMTCLALGIDPDPQPDDEAPTRKPVQSKAKPKKPAMKPAATAGGSGGSAVPERNVFTEIAEEFEAEDRGEA